MNLTELRPQPVTEVEIVFPTNVNRLMPCYDEIPKEYKQKYNL